MQEQNKKEILRAYFDVDPEYAKGMTRGQLEQELTFHGKRVIGKILDSLYGKIDTDDTSGTTNKELPSTGRDI